PRCPLHALSACPPGRRSQRRRHRRPAKRRLGRSREPHACAKSADGILAAGAFVRPCTLGASMPAFLNTKSRLLISGSLLFAWIRLHDTRTAAAGSDLLLGVVL